MSVEDKAGEQEQVAPKSFTQADIDKINADNAEATAGLKANHDKLLGEKKEAQQLKDQADESARLAREEAAKKSGDVEAIEKSLNERHALELSAVTDKLKARDMLILDGRKESIINDLAGKFIDSSKSIGKTILGNMVEVSYNEEGQPVTIFKGDDGFTTSELKSFEEYLDSNSAFQPLLKGTQMSGGGQRSENNSGRATDSTKTTKKTNGYLATIK